VGGVDIAAGANWRNQSNLVRFPEILFGSFFHSRASAGNFILNQATLINSYRLADRRFSGSHS